MPRGKSALFTIGYQGRDLEEVRGNRTEADPEECHRSLLAPRVAATSGCAVQDL